MDIQEIKRALETKPGKNKIGLAKALGRAPTAVTSLLKGTRAIKAREIPIIREYLELEPVVPVVGLVGATSEEVYYATADDPAETVPAPLNASLETVAVEIRGDSLGHGLNGWLAYYNDRREPVTPDLLGHLCVVGLRDGKVLIKVLRQAPRGRFHLFPNAGGAVIPDARVAWAARVIHLSPKAAT